MKNPEMASPRNTNSRTGVTEIEEMFTGGVKSKYAPNIVRVTAPIVGRIYV